MSEGKKLYGKESDKRCPHSETEACRERLAKYCTGIVLDLGCGPVKIKPDCIGIDIFPGRCVDIVQDVSIGLPFEDGSTDCVYSAHCLEDIEDTEAALREWLRVIKPGGYLVLYLPDKDYYYNIGHPLANKNHKHDFYWEDVWEILDRIGGVRLVHHARYGPVYEVGEWSFELVVQKL